jgi:hypothetical protein
MAKLVCLTRFFSVGKMMGTGQNYSVTSYNCHDVTAGMPNSSVTTKSFLGISRDITPKK